MGDTNSKLEQSEDDMQQMREFTYLLRGPEERGQRPERRQRPDPHHGPDEDSDPDAVANQYLGSDQYQHQDQERTQEQGLAGRQQRYVLFSDLRTSKSPPPDSRPHTPGVSTPSGVSSPGNLPTPGTMAFGPPPPRSPSSETGSGRSLQEELDEYGYDRCKKVREARDFYRQQYLLLFQEHEFVKAQMQHILGEFQNFVSYFDGSSQGSGDSSSRTLSSARPSSHSSDQRQSERSVHFSSSSSARPNSHSSGQRESDPSVHFSSSSAEGRKRPHRPTKRRFERPGEGPNTSPVRSRHESPRTPIIVSSGASAEDLDTTPCPSPQRSRSPSTGNGSPAGNISPQVVVSPPPPELLGLFSNNTRAVTRSQTASRSRTQPPARSIRQQSRQSASTSSSRSRSGVNKSQRKRRR